MTGSSEDKMAKFKFYQSDPNYLLPQRIGDLIPEDDIAWIILEIVDRLDLSKIANKYSHLGCDGFHPSLLLKIIFYGVATGNRSSRRIARLAKKDLAGIMLCGGEKPSWRTVARFLKANETEVKDLFLQVLQICISLDMVGFGHFCLDGTKIKANAHKSNSLSTETIEKKIAKLKVEITDAIGEVNTNDRAENEQYGESTPDDLPAGISSKKERLRKLTQALEELKTKADVKGKKLQSSDLYNFADPDSGLMKTSRNGFQQCYNHQLVVDAQERVIVAYTTSSNSRDNEQLKQTMEESSSNIARVPEKLSADTGYFSGENLAYFEDKPTDAYICPDQKVDDYHKEKFVYDSQNDLYICPSGRQLIYHRKQRKEAGKIVKVYWGDCSDCQYSSSCIKKSKKGRRQIERDKYDLLREEMRAKFANEQTKKIYALRKEIVEPVCGQIKQQQNFQQHLRKNLKSATCEFGLACLVYNVKRIWHKYNDFQGAKTALAKI